MRLICLNCGKFGHTNKKCWLPTNSYGCIVAKREIGSDITKYLLVQRRYSPEYFELLRGRYYASTNNWSVGGVQINYNYLVLLIGRLSDVERNYLMIHEFPYLWNRTWHWSSTGQEYAECYERFNWLKYGKTFGCHGHLTLSILFDRIPSCSIEPEWEFPKGRRKIGENDQDCAVRECCEESSLSASDFTIARHIKPIQEHVNGVNGVKYCNNLYLAQLTNHNVELYYDPTHTDQNNEIRKIGWYTLADATKLFGIQCPERARVLEFADQIISRVDMIAGS
jgi:8-oxo-dGTP pyrophosphatase MutT (NUDIX family)